MAEFRSQQLTNAMESFRDGTAQSSATSLFKVAGGWGNVKFVSFQFSRVPSARVFESR